MIEEVGLRIVREKTENQSLEIQQELNQIKITLKETEVKENLRKEV